MRNFLNLNKATFAGIGKYQIPQIEPETDVDIHSLEWIPFNYALSAKGRELKGLHFYVDDYQFERLWRRPNDYIALLKEFAAVTTPDFSTYTDMPVAMQIYNHYRKHWLGAYWQLHGINVIPTISWSTPQSYEWCFDGEPVDAIISISSVGTQKHKESLQLFSDGCREAFKRLQPREILWYGKVPDEFDWNVTRIKPHQDQIRERRIQKNGR